MNQEAFVELCRVYLVDRRKLIMSAAKLCVCLNDLRDFRMMGTQVLVLKLKFENFIYMYHKIKIFTGSAYAPCMGTPLHGERGSTSAPVYTVVVRTPVVRGM